MGTPPHGALLPHSAPLSPPQGLHPPPRLSRQRDLALVFSSGRRIQGRFMILICLRQPDLSRFCASVIARKKDFPLASTRNRAKRRLRELLRLNLHLCPQPAWLIILARPGAESAPWPRLLDDFSTCLQRLA